jgi:hypothetical protein
MIRFGWLAIPALVAACAPMQPAKEKVERGAVERGGYAGMVQKVFRVTRQGRDVPGIRLLGKYEEVFAPALRQSSETHQYVVRTATGQIIAQSDEEFGVGDCVEVIPQGDVPGPAFRYGQAQVVKSDKCTT